MASARHMEGDMAAQSSLYAVLYAPGEGRQANTPIPYDTKLRRLLCDVFNDFVPDSSYAEPKYRFGDGSAEAAVSAGIEAGLIGEKGGKIFLTKEGEAQAKKMWDQMPEDRQFHMGEMRDVYEQTTADEAMVFFYGDHPERADEAGEREAFEKNRLDCAVSMADNGPISVLRGSEVAGMRLREFKNEMIRRGISPYSYDMEAYEHDQKNLKMFYRH